MRVSTPFNESNDHSDFGNIIFTCGSLWQQFSKFYLETNKLCHSYFSKNVKIVS